MSESNGYASLHTVLRQVGIRTVDDRPADGRVGFPLSLELADGGSLVLDLPDPGFLAALDPEGVGIAVVDPLGYPRTTWGLARRVPFFRGESSVLDSPIGGLLEGSYGGSHGALYLDGFRYFSSAVTNRGGSDVFVLVVNANEERHARRQASKSWRMANALKRLGKALTMNQNTRPLCVAAAHEIASAAELAAVLVWSLDPEGEALELAASVGANRLGSSRLSRLSLSDASGCAAELVAATRMPFSLANVADHELTEGLEAKFCYLKPGGVSVHPLVISDRLLGVLELVGREVDPYFAENAELFETIAEHLALAINSATMFENFERLASHDALTGLANHRTMQETLHARFSEASRTGQGLGAIMIDVDHFRSFNEEEGHDAGDQVLKLVAEALKGSVRPYDLPARYGGEEFTVVMPGAGRETALAVAERIRSRIESEPFVTKSGRVVHVTISAGCATFPDHRTDAAGLLKAADTALYEAKRAGRNRVVFAEGAAIETPRPHGIPLESLRAWVHPLDWEEGERLWARVAPESEAIATALRLSASQRSILEGLLRVSATYRRAVRQSDTETLAAMEAAPEFRLLLPSLQRLDERFDGGGLPGMGGAKIPLLARVLQVLLALASGVPFFADPGLYDPEIVALLTVPRAA